jgi:hypothetical protein
VTMKTAVLWNVTPCRSCVNRRFGGTYRLHLQGRLQPPAHAGSSLADFSILKIKAICRSETSVYTRSTRRHIPEDGILQMCYLLCHGGKVNLSLCMKTYGGMIHVFLTLALAGGEWSASHPIHFIPRVPIRQESGCAPGPVSTTWRKILPYRDSKSDLSDVQPVASRYTGSCIMVYTDNTYAINAYI